jgi:hypothetical protein
MSQGGTFIRPGAVGRGPWDEPQPTAERTTPKAIENVLAAAAKDPDRVTDLLDELSRGRLWVPLPDDRPVTDGQAGPGAEPGRERRRPGARGPAARGPDLTAEPDPGRAEHRARCRAGVPGLALRSRAGGGLWLSPSSWMTRLVKRPTN